MDQMTAETAEAVSASFALGTPLAAPSYADRGELGRIWRLDTDRGSWAIKELLHSLAERDAAADVAFQRAAAAAGVPLPAPRLATDGRVLLPGSEAASPAATLRVYEWVELTKDLVTPADIGTATALLHRVEHPAAGPVPAWFAEPIGAEAYQALLRTATEAGACWAEPLAGWLPDLVALDTFVTPPDPARLQTCHLDVNTDNVRRGRGGGIVILDWENCAPAQPERELAGILTDLDMEISTEAAVAAYATYRESGGPATLTEPADFSTAISVQSRLLRFYGERGVAPGETDENRQRADRRLRNLLGRPLTPSSLKTLLAALHA